jgi:hypothetical protein
VARNKDFAGIAFFTKLDVAGIDSGMQILNTTGLKIFCFDNFSSSFLFFKDFDISVIFRHVAGFILNID